MQFLVLLIKIHLYILKNRFTPESVRWLLLQGQEDKARQELNKVAKINKKIMPKDDLMIPETTEINGNLLHLFKNRTLAKSTLINWDIW